MLGQMHRTDKSFHHQYCDFYESVLPTNVGSLLEIGIKGGASLKMWRDYYPGAMIVGIDILQCDQIEGCRVLQGNATSLSVYDLPINNFEIIIDDGSHLCSDQRKSFDLFWPLVNPGGFYIIEDVHSSFLGEYADESPTAYEWAMKLPGAIEWWRDPSNKSDSGTIIIPKPL